MRKIPTHESLIPYWLPAHIESTQEDRKASTAKKSWGKESRWFFLVR
jgi:hypothetical protein